SVVLLLGCLVFGALSLFSQTTAAHKAQFSEDLQPAWNPSAKLYLRTVSLELRGVTLENALRQIAQSAGIRLAYSAAHLPTMKQVTLTLTDVTLAEALAEALRDTDADFTLSESGLLVIGPKHSVAMFVGLITGKVMDDEGTPVVGANVFLEGTFIGAAANMRGEYSIRNVPPGSYTITASAVGYRKQSHEITVQEGETVSQDFILATDILRMDAVVVSGTPGGAGMRKRDASFAITTVEASDIVLFSPSSTANLMELVPGVWSESSGGVAGANIDVRGLPGGGDAPFVTMSINGAPLYGTEMLSFFEQSTIFRLDETVASAEALRGGPNSVFSSGEPGVTMNFTLKRGSEETKARVKYSTSDYDLQRVDAVLSGKLTDGLYYMAGGYAQTSPGVRGAQYNAEKGQQFTAQLTKIFDRGVINGFTRITDDHGQWILPMALNSGNDLGTFAQLGNATRFRELQVNAQGDAEIFDFSRGRGWKGNVSGLNATFDLGTGWTVRDNLSYTKGDANTFGFVPSGGPIRVSALGLPSVTTRGGQQLSGSAWVQNYGHWVVLKDLESFTNDISLAKIWQGHDITIGFYQAWWSARDFWT
ncbi:MAG: carboxypeptidase-like regulatory domain-containing protein, partial [Bacteroidota bacterium]